MALDHARRNQSAMAVVYLDLDGFKQINNTLGHAAGDALLKMVAERLVATVREEDTVARLGGDEFIIALWHLSGADDAATVASKVIDVVSQPYDIEGQTVSITTSAGDRDLSRPRRGCRDADEERGPGPVRDQARGQERLSHLGLAGRTRAGCTAGRYGFPLIEPGRLY